jgi:hypothetical protein
MNLIDMEGIKMKDKVRVMISENRLLRELRSLPSRSARIMKERVFI